MRRCAGKSFGTGLFASSSGRASRRSSTNRRISTASSLSPFGLRSDGIRWPGLPGMPGTSGVASVQSSAGSGAATGADTAGSFMQPENRNRRLAIRMRITGRRWSWFGPCRSSNGAPEPMTA